MKDKLKERIEKAGLEMEEQIEMLPKVEVGSDEETKAVRAAQVKTDIYCKLVETYDTVERSEAEIQERKNSNNREWVKTIFEIGLKVATIGAGIIAMRTIGIQSAIDEANGDLPSRAMREQTSFVNRIIGDWITGRGIK